MCIIRIDIQFKELHSRYCDCVRLFHLFAVQETFLTRQVLGVGSVVNCGELDFRKSLACELTVLFSEMPSPSQFSFTPLQTEDALIMLPPTSSRAVGWVNQLYTTALLLQRWCPSTNTLPPCLDHSYFSLFEIFRSHSYP